MDKITICDLEVFFRVGVTEEERTQPQRLLITVSLLRDLKEAMVSDSLEATTNYFEVTQRLKSLGVDTQWRLIETLAGDICEMLLTNFAVPAVIVEVKKFIIPETRYVSVTVSRQS